jgi:hypothetical protein
MWKQLNIKRTIEETSIITNLSVIEQYKYWRTYYIIGIVGVRSRIILLIRSPHNEGKRLCSSLITIIKATQIIKKIGWRGFKKAECIFEKIK